MENNLQNAAAQVAILAVLVMSMVFLLYGIAKVLANQYKEDNN